MFTDRIVNKQTVRVKTQTFIIKFDNCALQTCIEFNLSAESVWIISINTLLNVVDKSVLSHINDIFDIYEYDKGASSDKSNYRINLKINFPCDFYEAFGIGECSRNENRLILVYKNTEINHKLILSKIINDDKTLIEFVDTLNISRDFFTVLDFFYNWKMFRYASIFRV